MKYSIVVPLYNERESLAQLHREIQAVIAQLDGSFEIIWVDDGSTDESWSVVQDLVAGSPGDAGIRFRRNFGKSAALAAGVRQATGEWIVTLDADLQDDIAELPKLIRQAAAGFDLVNGWKIDRKDRWSKRLVSKLFNGLVNRLSGVRLHDHNCGFKLLRREIFQEIQPIGDWHRFIPILADARGWRVCEVAVHHRPRPYGRSKYGLSRLFKGMLDLITIGFLTNFHHRPQHILGSVGLVAAFGGAGGLIYLSAYWLTRMTAYPEWSPVHQRPLLYYSLGALIIGVHLLALGFLAELIVAHRASGHSQYSIAETVGTDRDRSDDSIRKAPATTSTRTPPSQHS